jgi:hypothetical protein
MTDRVNQETLDKWSEKIAAVEYDEDLTILYAEALTLAVEWGAVSFACDLASLGMKVSALHMMANSWREVEMFPLGYADALDQLADKVDEIGSVTSDEVIE